MVSQNMPPKNCVADFGLQRLSLVNLGVIIIPGRLRSAVQSFPSKQASCTFVATKLRFALTKVTCRMLAHRSGWPLFRTTKDGPGNLTTNVSKYEESENQVHQGKDDTGGSATV